MPPKKNLKTSESTAILEKPPKKKSCRKPKAETPQVSIPHSQLGSVVVESGSPIKYKRSSTFDLETKIQLANEVIRMQLGKKPTSPSVAKTPKKTKKKQVVSTFFENGPNETKNEKLPSPIKKTNKRTKKQEGQTKIVTRKRIADSTTLQNIQSSPIKQRKLDLNSTLGDSLAKSQEQPSNPIKPRPKPGPKRLTRGKKSQGPTPTATEPVNPTKTQGLPTETPVPTPKRKTRLTRAKRTVVQSPETVPNLPINIDKSPSLKSPPSCVDSRKTSVSSISNLSWTKDISSSSTATCVTASSNDFVRFDNKLPTIKLSNIDHLVLSRDEVIDNKIKEPKLMDNKIEEPKLMEKPPSSSDDSSSSSSSSDSESSQSDKTSVHNLLEEQSLNLSEISPSYSCSTKPAVINIQNDKKNLETTAKQLMQTMNKIDMEIINWMRTDSEDVSANFSKFKDKMFDILDREFSVITHCQRLKEVLNPQNIEEDKESTNNNPGEIETEPMANTSTHEILEDVDFVKPSTIPSVNRKLSNHFDPSPSIAQQERENSHHDNLDEKLLVQNDDNRISEFHDDDDALSLFAESITGFESSRMSSSIIGAVPYRQEPARKSIEEYIPIPTNTHVSSKQYSYNPTKLPEEVNKTTNVCEKQTADSTSIYKESNSTADDSETYEDFMERAEMEQAVMEQIPLKMDIPENHSEYYPENYPENQTRPRLYASIYDTRKIKSLYLFNDYCFFNLTSQCKTASRPGGKCRFSHVKPPVLLIKNKLPRLSDEMFIIEYVAMKNWSELRRKYGICFVEECDRRGMTRLLVEMALDFVLKAHQASQEDTDLRVAAIEITLLHLNNVDLSICEDILKYRIHYGVILCDVFMATMSVTQNFSRFKRVFLNLTYFMVDNDRTFTLAVAEHMLERICILPFEQPVAKALLEIMRLTNPSIFQNPMIRHFEKQIACNKDVFEEYTLMKNQSAFTSFLASSAKDLTEQALRPEVAEPTPLAPSPDTTNLDNLNKLSEEPSEHNPLNRSSGLTPPSYTHSPYKRFDDPGPSQTEETLTINPSVWNHKSIFDKIRTQSKAKTPRPVMGPPLRPLRPSSSHKKQFNRVVTFRNPINFGSRHSKPD